VTDPEIIPNLNHAARVLGLPPVDDDEEMRKAIEARVSAMNSIDRMSFYANVGRTAKEDSMRSAGRKYAIPTAVLASISLIFALLSVGSWYVVLDTSIWLVAKWFLGLLGVVWFFAAVKALQRVILRLVNGRDPDEF
jgi:hypothetical protein